MSFRTTVVCLGNICRSPMAEAVLRARVAEAGLDDSVVVDSAGTGDWNVGSPADARTRAALAHGGYAEHWLAAHRARQLQRDALDDVDLVVVMDRQNLVDVRRLIARGEADVDVRLLRSFDPSLAGLADDDPRLDVPDPYYDGADGFADTLAMIEAAADGLVIYAQKAAR